MKRNKIFKDKSTCGQSYLTIMYIAPDGITGFSPGTSFNPLYTRQAFSCTITTAQALVQKCGHS